NDHSANRTANNHRTDLPVVCVLVCCSKIPLAVFFHFVWRKYRSFFFLLSFTTFLLPHHHTVTAPLVIGVPYIPTPQPTNHRRVLRPDLTFGFHKLKALDT
ncbi:unnamed protein product, partial [Laminaria digitata]